jgi:hypothetical protein
MLARVVDFPEPVGPVTRIRPEDQASGLLRELEHDPWQPELLEGPHLVGDGTEGARHGTPLHEDVRAKS